MWSKTFGGTGLDEGRSVRQTTDGGYIIAGTTFSFGAGGADVYLVKTDASGNQEWSRSFGSSQDDRGYSVRQTADVGYIIAGYTNSYGVTDYDILVIKTDSIGNQTWLKTFGTTGDDYGFAMLQATDGRYVVAGYASPYCDLPGDACLLKVDTAGNLVWLRKCGGDGVDCGYALQQTTDGGYIVAGYSDSREGGANMDDVFVAKTDSNGVQLWYRAYGGRDYDYGYSVQQTADGGYIIAGETESFGAGFWDVYLIKTDAEGN
jgi:hypothetical protein